MLPNDPDKDFPPPQYMGVHANLPDPPPPTLEASATPDQPSPALPDSIAPSPLTTPSPPSHEKSPALSPYWPPTPLITSPQAPLRMSQHRGAKSAICFILSVF